MYSFEQFLNIQFKKILNNDYLSGEDLIKSQKFIDDNRYKSNTEENRKNAIQEISILTLKYVRNKKLKELNEKFSYR